MMGLNPAGATARPWREQHVRAGFTEVKRKQQHGRSGYRAGLGQLSGERAGLKAEVVSK